VAAEKPIPRRTVEALLRPEVVVASDGLKAGLRELGIDLEHLEPSYAVATMRLAMDLIRAEICPERDAAAGFRELGRRFVLGFKQTPVGWIFTAMAPLFGPDLTMQTLPRYLSSVRDNFPLSVIAEGDRRYRFISHDVAQYPEFIAGCVELVLETCGVPSYEVLCLRRDPGFELEVRWPK
jgi:uncharacterized protein (TIGR02265 family)